MKRKGDNEQGIRVGKNGQVIKLTNMVVLMFEEINVKSSQIK